MPEPVGSEWLNQPVRITRDAIHFGDHKLPGLILDGGITVTPGQDDDVNILTVKFIVGAVNVEDPT